jgi:putative NIF3 family GTP cyclohydrolase 1 type 2
MPIIIAGHWNTEVIILESLKKELETKFSNIAFIISSQKDPFEYI